MLPELNEKLDGAPNVTGAVDTAVAGLEEGLENIEGPEGNPIPGAIGFSDDLGAILALEGAEGVGNKDGEGVEATGAEDEEDTTLGDGLVPPRLETGPEETTCTEESEEDGVDDFAKKLGTVAFPPSFVDNGAADARGLDLNREEVVAVVGPVLSSEGFVKAMDGMDDTGAGGGSIAFVLCCSSLSCSSCFF